MAKFTRTFNGTAGTTSRSTRGPSAIIADLDALGKFFDTDQVGGGIGADNIQDGAITDAKIGVGSIDDVTAVPYANTGTLTQIMSWFAKQLKAIIGGAAWSSTPPDSLTGLDARLTTAEGSITDNQTAIAAKLDMTDGALKSVGGISNAKGDVDIVAGTGITVQKVADDKLIRIVATGEAVPAAHASSHASTGTDVITPADIGAAEFTFDMDVLATRKGLTKLTAFDTPTSGDITETVTQGEATVASKVTEFDTPTSGSITETVTVGSLSAVKVTTFSASITEVIT